MRVALLLIVMLAAACSGGQATTPDAPTAAVQLPTATSLPTAQPTPFTTEATQTPANTLTIWWPEALAPVERADVTELLNQQIEAFDSLEEGVVNIAFRVKRLRETGGIMPTLRTANQVAPGALPDLTLMRREDMLSAAEDGLIYPLDELLPPTLLEDLYNTDLGRYEGELYGLPYMLNVRLLAYQPGTSTGWSFAAVQESGLAWVFPAGRNNTTNDTLYLQYLDAGGRPTTDGTLDEEALTTLLTFYEAANVPPDVSTYLDEEVYIPDLLAGRVQAGVVDSATYLTLQAENSNLQAAPIPTLSGEPQSTLDGWMWVVTTGNTEQQELAALFLAWMMASERQREYAEAIHMLSSQVTALQSQAGVDVDFMDSLLANAIIPEPSAVSLTRSLQNALRLVLTDELTATEAVEEVLRPTND